MEGNKTNKKPIRWNVFIPCFLVVGGAAYCKQRMADQSDKGDFFMVFGLFWMAVSGGCHGNLGGSGIAGFFKDR